MKRLILKVLPFVSFLVIATVVVMIWFKDGEYLGGGDVGLPFYNPSETLSMVKYLWWGNVAPGFTYSQTLSSLPLYGLLNLLQKIFYQGVQIQIIVTLLTLFLSASAYYLITGEFINRKRVFWRLFAVGSYLFSSFMMGSVWHRFVYTTIIFSAVLPISVWLFIKLIKTRKFYYFIILQLELFVLSYIFGTFSHAITLWVTILIFGILFLLTSKEKIQPTSLVIWYFFTTVCWVIINLWWILPQLLYSVDFFATISSINSNLQTLVTISEKTPVQFILRGINSFYFYDTNIWGSIYTNPLFFSISWIPSLVIFVGYFVNKKSKKYLLFLLLWLLVIFAAKGSGSPLGGIFMFFFSRSFFVGVFRNVFEKIGLLLPFVSAFLITMSFMKLQKRIRGLVFGLLIISYIILVWFVFLWPYWTGNVFGEIGSRDVVNPPESYSRVNDFLKENSGSYRVLHLPMVGGGVTYNWDSVYSGIDPTHTLFDQEVISNTFGIKHIDSFLNSLSRKLSATGYNESFLPLIQALSVKYIVLHNDIDWRVRGLSQPEIIRRKLSDSEFVELVLHDGPLEVYKVKDEFLIPKVFLVDNPYIIYSLLDQGSGIVWDNSKNLKEEVYISNVEKEHQPLLKSAHIFSEKRVSFPSGAIVQVENALEELLHARFLPDSFYYPLIRIKEALEGINIEPSGRFERMLSLSGKRLVEINKLVENGNLTTAIKQLEEYDRQIDDFVVENNKGNVDFGLLKPTLIRHYYVLENIWKDLEKANINEDYLKDFRLNLIELGILPKYPLSGGLETYDKEIFRFTVFNSGEYEIVLELPPEYDQIYPDINEGIEVFIDGEKETRFLQQRGEIFTIGKVYFEVGVHEVGYTSIKSINLVSLPQGANGNLIELESGDHSGSTLYFNISNHYRGSTYSVNFDYWIQQGHGATFRIVQDTDPVVRGKHSYVYEKFFRNDIYKYNWYWNSVGFMFGSRQNSLKANLEFVINPWDDCIKNLIEESRCETERYRFQKKSKVNLKNIQVKRLFNPELVLKNSTTQSDQSFSEGYVTNLIKNNPTNYSFDMEIKEPSYLVFSESYYPYWELKLDGEKIDESNHYYANIYANGWYVSDPGKYKAEISFSPQKDFRQFIIYSILFGGLWVLVVYTLKRKFKKVL